jgi:hypothetical protein
VRAFLDWAIRTRYPTGMALTTMVGIASTWRNVTEALSIPGEVPIASVEPVEMADRYAARAARQPFASHATYRTRLRRAIDLYYTHHPTTGRAPTSDQAPDLVAARFPLRPNVTVVLWLPTNLTPAEADLLAEVVHSRAPEPGRALSAPADRGQPDDRQQTGDDGHDQ